MGPGSSIYHSIDDPEERKMNLNDIGEVELGVGGSAAVANARRELQRIEEQDSPVLRAEFPARIFQMSSSYSEE